MRKPKPWDADYFPNTDSKFNDPRFEHILNKPDFTHTFSIENAKNTRSRVFDVTSRLTEKNLGRVYFHPQWLKYVFEPHENTLYDAVCLSAVAAFCDAQTQAWKEGK